MPLESAVSTSNPVEIGGEAPAHFDGPPVADPPSAESVEASVTPGSAMNFLANFPLYPFL
jgi:hypothetical protein